MKSKLLRLEFNLLNHGLMTIADKEQNLNNDQGKRWKNEEIIISNKKLLIFE